MTNIAALPISIPTSAVLGYFMDKRHSKNSVSYQKRLRIQAFETLEAFKMYYTIGMSYVSSLLSDSLINYYYSCTSHVCYHTCEYY